eukprot:CAMPEP_0202033472 /NCGR_PEP_ID=MMETSP0905-20130828/66067_1 /ASSEMBLY_ACC=CAM_ASM_000554 /TAXON_ID=420261 /ORGANISM="Thalassiosira antarctica, Strain CCMP982" /LENGTH=57 /DNA_ID=CAMNT_0048597377 /DNA_START=716 /DNA_END=889 /DNA_ORIENTATION=+
MIREDATVISVLCQDMIVDASSIVPDVSDTFQMGLIPKTHIVFCSVIEVDFIIIKGE